MLYIEERAKQEGLSPKVILKEALQVCILEKLYSTSESDNIIFQGGTCLRLLYGGPRYSEDLDFIITDRQVLSSLLERLSSQMENISPLFEGKIWLRVQKDRGKLVRWKVYYQSAEGQKRTSVSIEFADYPVYTSVLAPLNFPRGYPAAPLILVNTETEEEILADKITALAARKYLKGRDIFDVWLLNSKGVPLNFDMVKRKLKDYSAHITGMEKKIMMFSEKQISQDLKTLNYRQKFEKQGYGILLTVARSLAREVDNLLQRDSG